MPDKQGFANFADEFTTKYGNISPWYTWKDQSGNTADVHLRPLYHGNIDDWIEYASINPDGFSRVYDGNDNPTEADLRAMVHYALRIAGHRRTSAIEAARAEHIASIPAQVAQHNEEFFRKGYEAAAFQGKTAEQLHAELVARMEKAAKNKGWGGRRRKTKKSKRRQRKTRRRHK